MNEFLQRFKLMLTDEQFDNLLKKRVIVFGVGGVGGNTAEMLVRSGISNLTIVDFDKIDITNINRQVVALHSTVGRSKVEVLSERLMDINPNLSLNIINDKLTTQSVNIFLYLASFSATVEIAILIPTYSNIPSDTTIAKFLIA